MNWTTDEGSYNHGYISGMDEVFAFLNEASLEHLPLAAEHGFGGTISRNTFKAFLAKRLRNELAERLGLNEEARRKYGIE